MRNLLFICVFIVFILIFATPLFGDNLSTVIFLCVEIGHKGYHCQSVYSKILPLGVEIELLWWFEWTQKVIKPLNERLFDENPTIKYFFSI